MDSLEPSAPQRAAGVLLLAALFVVRELASGALKEERRRTVGVDQRLGDDCKSAGALGCKISGAPAYQQNSRNIQKI
jgi:hypothetical protein